jgi:hypothetical protein
MRVTPCGNVVASSTSAALRGLAVLLLVGIATAGAAAPPPAYPDAVASDPATMGWMQGAPPPADRVVDAAEDSFYVFPRTRWSFAHMRQLRPSTQLWRGEGAVSTLPRAERKDIDAVRFTPLGGGAPMTWEQSLGVNYTDAILVLHRGRIVYERYFGVMTPHTPHMLMSVTKSFVGLLAAILVEEGALDPAAPVAKYVPELAQSGFGDATVRQVMDMTTGLHYSEDYSDPNAEVWQHMRAGGLFVRPPGYQGPVGYYEFLKTVRKEGEHGAGFAYKTVNTDVLGWIVRRVTGKSLGALVSERLWQPLGVENDGYWLVDPVGTEFAGGGLNLTLRDMARFGEMLRLDGRYNGRQIVPAAVVADIRRGASKEDFAKAQYATMPGWSYRSMWWVTHNDHGAFAARGVHGQLIYVDPKAEMVIVRFGSHPLASNINFDPTSLPAWQAVAEHLMR